MTQLAVCREVLTFDVGVDRHLCNLASTGWTDEVDRHRSALLLQYPSSVVRNHNLHRVSLEHDLAGELATVNRRAAC